MKPTETFLLTVFPWVAAALVLLACFIVGVRSRNEVWLSAIRMSLSNFRRLNSVLGGVGVLAIAGMIVLGVGFIQAGYPFGAGLGCFLLAAGLGIMIGFYVWIATRPWMPNNS